MREETQKLTYIFMFIIFAITFYLLRNNVYCIDDLIYHFLEQPLAVFREYYYGTWIMPFQNITMYIMPRIIGINFQDWALIGGTTIKALTITLMMLCFLKTFLNNEINKIYSYALTFFVFMLLFCLFGQNKFADLIIMSGFFRFIIPAALLIWTLYLMFKHFTGKKTNLYLLFPVCFLTAYASEITAGILLVSLFILFFYKETEAKNIKEVLPYMTLLLVGFVGTLCLVCSTGFNYHITNKLGTQPVTIFVIYENLSEFTKVFINSLIVKYIVFWLIALCLYRFNKRREKYKHNIFAISVLSGVLIFGFSLIIMGKTNYDGGYWIEHKDIYSVFIPAILYAVTILALPYIKKKMTANWFRNTFVVVFVVFLVSFCYYSNQLEKELYAIKEYTYLRDKIRLFYYYKGQKPIYPMSTHICLADKHIKQVYYENKFNRSDNYYDDNFIHENSNGYLTMDKYYYPLNYKIYIDEPAAPVFLSHKDGIKSFLNNGGSIDEINNKKYRFKDLKNKDFVLNNR